MQELTLVLLRVAYLAILWIFVLGAISVIRSDMFGARVEVADQPSRRDERTSQRAARRQKPTKPAKGIPTRVVVTDGPSAGETVPLDSGPVLIGRGPDATIRLDDDYVSTRHARIGRTADTCYVEDLGSTNGTYIGSQRITQATALQTGSRVRVGKTTLELKK